MFNFFVVANFIQTLLSPSLSQMTSSSEHSRQTIMQFTWLGCQATDSPTTTQVKQQAGKRQVHLHVFPGRRCSCLSWDAWTRPRRSLGGWARCSAPSSPCLPPHSTAAASPARGCHDNNTNSHNKQTVRATHHHQQVVMTITLTVIAHKLCMSHWCQFHGQPGEKRDKKGKLFSSDVYIT